MRPRSSLLVLVMQLKDTPESLHNTYDPTFDVKPCLVNILSDCFCVVCVT